jgi:AraC-like DNA-binding protein
VAGHSVAQQCGSEFVVRAGDAIVLTPGTGEFRIARSTPARFVGLRVPRHEIAPTQAAGGDQAARVVPKTHPALQLLSGYLQIVLSDGAMPSSPGLAPTIAKHLHELVALSLGLESPAVERGAGVRAARLAAIKADIEANLADTGLTVSAVAARHGVSTRYVHLLFELEGTTFTRFVLRHRLDRAYQRLRDPRFAGRSISTIAYDVGFGDLSYFNRTFRRRYDASPSEIRRL